MYRIELPSFFDPEADSAESKKSDILATMLVAQYQNVKNAPEIKKRIVSGDPTLPQCLILNPDMILDEFQLRSACSRAYMNQKSNLMKTKSLLTEIIFSLSPTTSISDSIKNFGINETLTSIYVLVPSVDSETDHEIFSKVESMIDGDNIPISSLSALTNLDSVKKVYKLQDVQNPSREFLVDVVVGMIATKGFL